LRARTGARERVADRMAPLAEALLVAPDEGLADPLAKLVHDRCRRALVMQDDRLVGLLSIADLARPLQLRGGEGPLGRRR
jgi:CBS domain-containing protein